MMIDSLYSLIDSYTKVHGKEPDRILCHPEMATRLKHGVEHTYWYSNPSYPDQVKLLGLLLYTKSDMHPGSVMVCCADDANDYPKARPAQQWANGMMVR